MDESLEPSAQQAALEAEIVRLNKVVTALMNRAEREMGTQRSHYGLFEMAVTLENQVKNRTLELQAALRENERVTRDLLREKEEQRALIKKLEEAQNQLLQSEKLASLGQLAAGIAHEVNNPIGFVNSNLGVLKRYLESIFQLLDGYDALLPELEKQPELRARIEELKEAADIQFLRQDAADLIAESADGTDRVRRIVQDLRDFSRVGDVSLEAVDIHSCIESTLKIVASEIHEKADVVRDYGRLPAVECRPSQINQVLLNLLLNAAQAIHERGTITLATRCEPRDGKEWAVLAIADTGCGIPEENRARIFDPFFTTKPVGAGTGLGLSVSYGIIQKHGGFIEVESEIDQGTTFNLWLPLPSKATAQTQ